MIARPAEKTIQVQPGDWAIRSQCVVVPEGPRPAAVWIRGEKIVAVVPPEQLAEACPVEDVGRLAILPGLVDSHVHINEPGRTEWEGFATATRAAAAGGITTLVDMPLDSVPTTISTDALHAKRAAADGRCHVDVGFWAGAVPVNIGELAPLLEPGVVGLRCFLA